MSSKQVAVVGSVVHDLVYRVDLLPMPGESAVAQASQRAPGGKGANQAVACARLGVHTLFLGRVGEDEDGRAAHAALEAAGVDARVLATPEAPTGHAAVLVDESGENLIAVDLGANAQLRPEDLETHRAELTGAGVILTQLEIPGDTVREVARLGRESGATTILNAAPARASARDLFDGFEIVVLNRGEAEQVAEVGIAGLDDALAALRALHGMGVPSPIVTLGPVGVVYLDRGHPELARAPEVEALDTTGAGDAFVGALGAFLAEGLGLDDAVMRACHLAAMATTALGARTAYPDRDALEAFERAQGVDPA